MEPLAYIVWAAFFFSLSMMPLGLMLGSPCCGCSGQDRVSCYTPKQRCFRILTTYNGQKSAASYPKLVNLGIEYLKQQTYGTASYYQVNNDASVTPAGVFLSYDSFSFTPSIDLNAYTVSQLSYGETATLSASVTASGDAHMQDGQCLSQYAQNVLVVVEKPLSIVLHGWDFPISPTNANHPTYGITIHTPGYQSDVLDGKKDFPVSKNAALSHAVVGLEVASFGSGALVAATAAQVLSWLTVNTFSDGSYQYSASVPPGVFAYSAASGMIQWTVRVFHGQAFHDEVVSLDFPPSSSIPATPPLAVLGVGVHVTPPQATLATPPENYYDEATGQYHVWARPLSYSSYVFPNFITVSVALSASQSSLLTVGGVALSWSFVSNPLAWTLGNAVVFSSVVSKSPRGENYFHRPYQNLYSLYPCYSRDTAAVLAYMNGQGGLVYSTQPQGGGQQFDHRLDADNSLCGLDVTNLPATLLPDSVTVSLPSGQPLFGTPCNDCPSSVSMRRVSNEMYFAPAADMHNVIEDYYYYGVLRSYAGGTSVAYSASDRTLFAASLHEAIGHSDAVGYLDGFFAPVTASWWTAAGGYTTATLEIGGDAFLENFDTPLVKHVTTYESPPRTLAVHGHKGVYPPSTYKVEVAVSDVEVVTQWEETEYHSDHQVVRKWLVNGQWVTTPTAGVEWRDFLEFIEGSYPHQPTYELPNPKKDQIIDAIKSQSQPTSVEVFLGSHGSYPLNTLSAVPISWVYYKPTAASPTAATTLRLKCDGTFEPSPSIGTTPTYSISEPVQEDSEGLIFRFSGAWGTTGSSYGSGAYSYPLQIMLADQLPAPPSEIPAARRSYPHGFSQQNSFAIGSHAVPLPAGGEDSYEVAFYLSFSTNTGDAELESVPYTIEYSNGYTYTGNVAAPGAPYSSTGVYLLKVTLSVTVTKGDPPSDSCGISVDVGNPDTPAEALTKEDVTFTFNNPECILPMTFRGFVWPHAGRPFNNLFSYYVNANELTLTGRQHGHVFHLRDNDPDGSADSYLDSARTPYQSHDLSPVNVGETLYPYPQSPLYYNYSGIRPGSREGVWQGHIYVQGEQYDDLTYTYQYVSGLSVDACETSRANWRLMLERTIPRDTTLIGVAMSREAKFTVVGWHVPGETVRVGYVSHKQFGRPRTFYYEDMSGFTEAPAGSGWYPVSRYYNATAASGYYTGSRFHVPGLVATSAEATCGADGWFSVELNEASLSGDVSIFVQPVNPKTNRGRLEYVRSKPSLAECREEWTFVTAIYITKTLAPPASLSPETEKHNSIAYTLADYAVPGGYVVGPYTQIRLVVTGLIKESSVVTRVRLYDTLSGKLLSTAFLGGGDFATGLISIVNGTSQNPGTYGTGGTGVNSLWFTMSSAGFSDGQIIQVAAFVDDDLGNESTPVLLSGLIRLDNTTPPLSTVFVNGLPFATSTIVMNDISKQSPVIVSGVTEPGSNVSIGSDQATAAGVVTATTISGSGEFAIPTSQFNQTLGTLTGGSLLAKDIAGNQRTKYISIYNRLPEIAYASRSGGAMQCALSYVQNNAVASFVFSRSDGATSPVLTVSPSNETATASFTDPGYTAAYSYTVQVSVVLPNGATAYQGQANVVQL